MIKLKNNTYKDKTPYMTSDFEFEYFEKIPNTREFQKIRRNINLDSTTEIKQLIELCSNNYSDPTLKGWFHPLDRNFMFIVNLERIKKEKPNLDIDVLYYSMMVPGHVEDIHEYSREHLNSTTLFS